MSMQPTILLCTDLDRTLLPNGEAPESALARPLLQALSERNDICLVYVSGRDRQLLQQAIDDYQIPVPDFAIANVGATIYQIKSGRWCEWPGWQTLIAPDWNDYDPSALVSLLRVHVELRLQERHKQHRFKLSYYTPLTVDTDRLLSAIEQQFHRLGIHASLIWSVDEAAGVGLLDILPAKATKLGALQYLMQRGDYSDQEMVFSGDSGNDLVVLSSGLNATLVRNASTDVRRAALAAIKPGMGECLYLAQGGFLGMNGYYAAGILEGFVHFFPHYRSWLYDTAEKLSL